MLSLYLLYFYLFFVFVTMTVTNGRYTAHSIKRPIFLSAITWTKVMLSWGDICMLPITDFPINSDVSINQLVGIKLSTKQTMRAIFPLAVHGYHGVYIVQVMLSFVCIWTETIPWQQIGLQIRCPTIDFSAFTRCLRVLYPYLGVQDGEISSTDFILVYDDIVKLALTLGHISTLVWYSWDWCYGVAIGNAYMRGSTWKYFTS